MAVYGRVWPCSLVWLYYLEDCGLILPHIALYRQPQKGSEYQTLVLNDGPFGKVLAVSLFRRRAHAPMFFTAVSKRDMVSQDVRFLLAKVMYSISIA